MRRRAPTSIPPAQLSLFDRLGLVPRPVPPPPPPPPPALSPPPAPPTPRPVEPDLRHVHLNGHPVAWELRRARRRTIGLLIDERGLRVNAPRSVSLVEIERALHERADWILRKLVEWREHAARRERLAPRWEDGAPLRVLGRALVLRIDPAQRGVNEVGGELRVGLPHDTDPERLKDLVQAWLQRQAHRVFAERIPVFAERLGRAPRRWTLSSARTRWGSCTSDGTIRLSWRLVHFPADIIDYVIAHELAHLREMNHGPRFWSTVGELFPEYEQARSWLRRFPDDDDDGTGRGRARPAIPSRGVQP